MRALQGSHGVVPSKASRHHAAADRKIGEAPPLSSCTDRYPSSPPLVVMSVMVDDHLCTTQAGSATRQSQRIGGEVQAEIAAALPASGRWGRGDRARFRRRSGPPSGPCTPRTSTVFFSLLSSRKRPHGGGEQPHDDDDKQGDHDGTAALGRQRRAGIQGTLSCSSVWLKSTRSPPRSNSSRSPTSLSLKAPSR